MKFTVPGKLPEPKQAKLFEIPEDREKTLQGSLSSDPVIPATAAKTFTPEVKRFGDFVSSFQIPRDHLGRLDSLWLEREAVRLLGVMPMGMTHFIGEVIPGIAFLMITGRPFAYLLATGVAGRDGNLLQARIAQREWSSQDNQNVWEVYVEIPEIVKDFTAQAWNYVINRP